MTAIPVSAVIGGPISGALLGLSGRLGLTGWQWLFLLEGLPAVVLGVAVLRYLPDRPEGAAWLAPEQRRWLAERLGTERDRCAERHGFSVIRALSSGVVWQMGLLVFLSVSFGQYALALWLPQIVRGFSGLSNLQVGFVSAIPNLVAVIAMVIVAAHSDRTGERCLHIAAASAVAAVGFLGCALSGFAGPYAIGLLNGASGNFRSGLLLLAFVPLAGMALALRLRHAAVLRDVT